MAQKQKILIYMSGGVDSSVAAALLLKDGYDVTGAFMVDYDDPESPGSCWYGDYEDTLRVCAKLGIKLLRLDFRKEYKKLVLDYMYKEYEAGRTPNPDVLCNKYIKFGVWLDKARELGFDLVATGHYARLKKSKKQRTRSKDFSGGLLLANCSLLIAKDTNKDQTYFLHQLTQEQLRSVVFPLGKYTKPEVRKLAKKFNLPTAEKEESMGICFIGEVPMKEFLQKKIKIKKGNIVLSPTLFDCHSCESRNLTVGRGGVSNILCEHDGLAFYTIGQRVGLVSLRATSVAWQSSVKQGIASSSTTPRNDNNQPLFVVAKNLKKNELVVGCKDDPLLHKREIQVGEINWISGQPPKFPLKCKVRLRHRQELQNCHCEPKGRSNLLVKFTKPERAPTPGQFAVFYVSAIASAKEDAKGECLGGGVIQ